MTSHPAAEVLLNYLRSVTRCLPDKNAVLNIDELPEEFKELGSELLLFSEYINETRALAKAISKGILNEELPPRENEMAAPLKSLHASLKHLTWQVQQIAKGDYNQRVDYLGEFSASFNIMIEQLAEREKILQTSNRAEAASKAKSVFLANMSHEMRTPMNVILGIAEIQLQEENLSADAANAFGRIYESGDLLLSIINDILDLSKIEAGKLELIPVNYDIPSLLNDTAQLNRLRYDNKPLIFNINVDENTPHNLFGDVLRIKQILNNILSNAFKYTEKGTINFSVSSETIDDANVTIIFSVSDTGHGMTEDQINLLFEEYTRFNADANRETSGTGLGMSITKRLVELMNGTINVESEYGKGSLFTVRIPQKRIDTHVCGQELAKNLRSFRFQSTEIFRKAQFLREYMPYGKVLVVDDVESNIYVAKGMLALYGLEIETASSGFIAIEKIKNGSVYDIIFMDHMMPKMDGIETEKIIRSMNYRHAIIALTANVLIGKEKMFIESGFDGFISKPIDSRELNHVLNEFIRNKKSHEVVEAARQKQQKEGYDYNINTINASKQRAVFAADARNVINILGDFYKKINILDEEEIRLFTVTVHGMKSALINIGEKDLSDLALKLERAGEERRLAVIADEVNQFINALQSLYEEFKPTDEEDREISDDDKLYLREKLLVIKTACANYDNNTAKSALNDLRRKIWSKDINNLLDEITMHLLHSALKKTVSVIEKFMS